MKSKPDWIIILAIQPTSGRWLMVYHQERGWELPGGRIEDSESVEVAASVSYTHLTLPTIYSV